MLVINIENVEKTIFENQDIRKLLSDFSSDFNQWKLSKMIPSMKNLGKQSLLNFLNKSNDNHKELLSKYFNEKIVINKLSYNVVSNHTFDLDKTEEILGISDNFPNFCIGRNSNQMYISLWR